MLKCLICVIHVLQKKLVVLILMINSISFIKIHLLKPFTLVFHLDFYQHFGIIVVMKYIK